MKDDDKKYIGRQFIKKLSYNSTDEELFKKTLKEFALELPANRKSVAMSLLEIGADQSETGFDRNYALSQLGLIVRTCGLRNDMDLQKKLNNIIDGWMLDLPHIAPWGALWALGRVNQNLGLEKCDQVIKHYRESETGSQVRKLRKDLERLNPNEPDTPTNSPRGANEE